MTTSLGDRVWRTDSDLVAAILAGEEAAFSFLVAGLTGLLIRIAETYVPSRAVAEEVVQDTWLAVLKGLPRFEGRSSLKTWIVNIVINRAKTTGQKENRSIPFASANASDEPWAAVPADHFQPADGEFPHHWSTVPTGWPPLPDQSALDTEITELVLRTCEALPQAQREVLIMRDVGGFDSDEVCAALGLSQGNQRVLLHRARSRVRADLEDYFAVKP